MQMKKCSYTRVGTKFLVTVLLLFSTTTGGLRSIPHVEMASNGQGHLNEDKDPMVSKIDATGSGLPDCSHACGPCFPCNRVMVSFKCSVAESCPIVYRCTCKGKFYHVPSN